MSTKCLDAIYKNTNFIRECSYTLDGIASAFSHTGNEEMAKMLGVLSDNILTAQEKITQAYAEEISEDLKRSEQSTANMVNAALAMITVGDKR